MTRSTDMQNLKMPEVHIEIMCVNGVKDIYRVYQLRERKYKPRIVLNKIATTHDLKLAFAECQMFASESIKSTYRIIINDLRKPKQYINEY